MTIIRLTLFLALLLSPLVCRAGGFDSLDAGPAASHPLWQRGAPPVSNARFIGNWCTFSVLDLGISLMPIATRLQVVPDRENGWYVLTLRLSDEKEQPPVVIRGALVELNGQLFLDLESSEKGVTLHRVFRVVLDRGIPRLVRWQLWKLSPGAASEIGMKKNGVVTATTKQLRKFVAEHADDNDVFPTAGENCDSTCFEGVPEGVFPLRPERVDGVDVCHNRGS